MKEVARPELLSIWKMNKKIKKLVDERDAIFNKLVVKHGRRAVIAAYAKLEAGIY